MTRLQIPTSRRRQSPLPIAILLVTMVPLTGSLAHAQIAVPTVITTEEDRFLNLQDQLLNRLRATREDQQAYILYVIERVREGKIETKLVVAIERYAMRRNRDYPFPFFERALRYESAKRGVDLPPLEHFASSRVLPTPTGTTR